ncbi:MAG: alpha-glucan family phosphorylase [Haliscomenobacter sp.]|nr:alpha-glucan family phosphorylase [Haliscomenobacter sp.]MBK8878906.1 alpha-glucan family phosphorylase [Haliscomenobacter sp.]
MVDQIQDSSIKLKRIFIESKLPEQLAPLQDLAHNLWWSWNRDAMELLMEVDPDKWEAFHYNPIAIIDQLPVERARQLLADPSYLEKLAQVSRMFQDYLDAKSKASGPRVAYFSMEFGLHSSIRIYSGGLGVLAGDYLKEASDCNIDMTGIGLLYRYGYFQQTISLHGDQINNFPPQEYTKLPMTPVRDKSGEWLKIGIDFPGRTVYAKAWMLPVGRIPLYLLDTDIPENSWEDRMLTHQLYGGDTEHRLKQEMVLGIGGIRLLAALGEEPEIFHCNEGHAAFMGIERLRQLMHQRGQSYPVALELVRASSLFTTHTPVPAGHDYFSDDLLRTYLSAYVAHLGIGWDTFLALGKINPYDGHELFSMSHLAIRLCQEVNGVSRLHGKVSQQMFKVLYPGYNYQELHIGYVTNGVHYPTWIAHDWHTLFIRHLGREFIQDQSNLARWEGVKAIPEKEIRTVRQQLKKRLLDYVRNKLRQDMTKRGDKPSAIFETIEKIRPDALVIGFARRFATYKRAHLLFNNLERLKELLNTVNRPVLVLYAGKAHPADHPGQALIREIIHISRMPEFVGKIIFLEGYNMELAKLLVQGVDIWLNTPTRPKEASGTSGMKAALNGVLNLSVLDGWWAEGYLANAGWALPLEASYTDATLQDELDAETIYNLLETEIIPMYFENGEEGYSSRWINLIRNTISKVGPRFTMKRMLDDYREHYYARLHKRSAALQKNNFTSANEVAVWKALCRERWDGVHAVEKEVFDTDNYSLNFGESFKVRIKVAHNGIPPQQLGLEAVFFKRISETELDLRFHRDLKVVDKNDHYVTFAGEILPQISGVYEYGFRLYPKHELMPHKQDLCLVKWL